MTTTTIRATTTATTTTTTTTLNNDGGSYDNDNDLDDHDHDENRPQRHGHDKGDDDDDEDYDHEHDDDPDQDNDDDTTRTCKGQPKIIEIRFSVVEPDPGKPKTRLAVKLLHLPPTFNTKTNSPCTCPMSRKFAVDRTGRHEGDGAHPRLELCAS